MIALGDASWQLTCAVQLQEDIHPTGIGFTQAFNGGLLTRMFRNFSLFYTFLPFFCVTDEKAERCLYGRLTGRPFLHKKSKLIRCAAENVHSLYDPCKDLGVFKSHRQRII